MLSQTYSLRPAAGPRDGSGAGRRQSHVNGSQERRLAQAFECPYPIWALAPCAVKPRQGAAKPQTNQASSFFGWGGIAAGAVQFGAPARSGIGSNFKVYSRFHGNQFVSVARFSKLAGAAANTAAAAGVLIEGYGVAKGDVDFGQFLINSSFAGIGVVGGLPGAIVSGAWFLADPLTVTPGHNAAQDTQYYNGGPLERCF